ncbi:HsdM family class I SAM-dependent methyltransferase [Gallionella capsiferriformans]|uniref:site-specific DNA-methyltransferase (adenine-specific) n=1 Tax=Gallionella capsiferriformans (strain ES-2) TaxID=395494 RepID=D9SDG4_GALCS|nr:N-6 DNA methylase [Gallionella capsiferriformans]ADL56762.1 N-6 DNA methylase [Gallionella capsiferriformans ES-2]
MSLTPEMRQSIDQIRNYLYGGGYPDPMSNAEQLSFLFFFYLIEGIDAENTMKAKVMKQPYESLFAGEWTLRNPLNAPESDSKTITKSRFKWSVWAKGLSGESLVRFVRDEVFPFFAEVAERSAFNFMNGARLTIDEPTVLTQVVNLVDGLRLDQADADTKGDLFEHVLRQIKQAGELGQFRTPRHVIRAIVEMLDPKIGETIYDPAAGTAGFLAAAYNHIRLANSSPSGISDAESDGKLQKRGIGDKLSAAQVSVLQNSTFYGNDVDPKMVRLATMNLTLRGLPNVRIQLRNGLTTTQDNERKAELGLPLEGYHVVLANPPFSGRVDKDRIVDEVKVGTSTATEILFLKYMMDCLRPGGRCGVIIPEGVLFGSTGAHKELRRQLIENNTVEAVLSLPGGVFQPYSGVKTSVLFFKKGGTTDKVMFLHADNDGYKMDANHDTPIAADDLPMLADAYLSRKEKWAEWAARDVAAEWTQQWWFADTATLRSNDFNLSAGRYRPMSQTAVIHRNPRELLDELAAIETEIAEEVEALRAVLGELA